MERMDLAPEILQRIAKGSWIQKMRIQAALVNHPRTPLGEAMHFLNFLMWREICRVIVNFKLPPELRHRAEALLMQRTRKLATGEKVTLARIAAGQVLKLLRLEKDARVVKGLLENPRLVEDDVLYLINQRSVPAPVLEAVARDMKWSSRREVRVALLRNPRTPLACALTFVTSLTEMECQQLLRDPKVPMSVRKAISRKSQKR